MKKTNLISLATSLILFFVSSAIYAESAVIRTDSNLYENNSSGSKVTASLKSGTKVEIVSRKNGWYQIKYGPILKGWVPFKTLKVSTSKNFASYLDRLPKESAPKEDEDEDPRYSEAGDSSDEPIKGVRALSGENISSVEPDAEAVKALEKFAVNKDQASDFAAELGLKVHKVDWLVKAESEPAKESSEDNYE